MPKSLYVDPNLMRKAGKIKFNDIPVNAYNKTIKEERSRYSDDDLVRIYRDIAVLRENDIENLVSQFYNQTLVVKPRNTNYGTGITVFSKKASTCCK